MIGGYWQYGRRYADERRPAAIDALRRAERLATGSSHEKELTSLRLVLEAEERLAQGTRRSHARAAGARAR